MNNNSRCGFTLIELLVVIGIIGILAGILMTSFSGGTSSARAAKCLSNMRNLAQVTIGCAAKNHPIFGEHFPLAGSRAVMNAKSSDGSIEYLEETGWISWLSMKDEYGMRGGASVTDGTAGSGTEHPKSFVKIKNASAYSSGDDSKEQDFAIQNGAIWPSMNGNRECYVCPEHALAVRKKGLNVHWSYVMNAYFGYDWSDGQKAVDALEIETNDRVSLNSTRLDRTLLFAELPFNDHDFSGSKIDTEFSSSASTENDPVLQYGAKYDGEDFNQKWKGSAESIAFNHKAGSRWCAHVVFADGHTEKLLLPKGGGGLTREQLTALLCGDDKRGGGKDISFDGKSYTKLKTK